MKRLFTWVAVVTAMAVPLVLVVPVAATDSSRAGGTSWKAESISVGYQHTCAVSVAGEAWCWGDNSDGQLGDGTLINRISAVRVEGLPTVTTISAGSHSTCALTVQQEVWCWGDNAYGALGDGTFIDHRAPAPVTGLPLISSLSGDSAHVCALSIGAQVWCWGFNMWGQVGDGTTRDRNRPALISAPAAKQVSVGGVHTCLVTELEDVWCWGSGVLADPWYPRNSLSPIKVDGISRVRSLSSGAAHTCAVDEDDVAWCWGLNRDGELGDGTVTGRLVPQPVQGLPNVRTIRAGESTTCAISVDDELWCWGDNGNGHLVDGSSADQYAPVLMSAMSSPKSLALGYDIYCVTTLGGEALCWGSSSTGALGNGPSEYDDNFQYSHSPVSASSAWIYGLKAVSTSHSIELNWTTGGHITGLRVQEQTDTGWTDLATLPARAQSASVTGFRVASAHVLRVVGDTDFGVAGSDRVVVFTPGTATQRIHVATSDGDAVVGGTVTWASKDGHYRSSVPYGLTALGAADLLSMPAGVITIQLVDGVLSSGTHVSGKWTAIAGKDRNLELFVPVEPGRARHQINVDLPGGQPVSGAKVTVSGLSASVTQGGFTFAAADAVATGITAPDGVFFAVGYPSEGASATVEYDDGALVQSQFDVPLNDGVTEVTLTEMPWLDVVDDQVTADLGDLVLVPVVVTDTTDQSVRPRRRTPTTVSIIAPDGAPQKCKGRKLSGVAVRGKVTLAICASKSGVYRLKGRGAVATGALKLRVAGAPSTPVTALTAVSSRPGRLTVAWNPPWYAGGSRVTGYRVTVSGVGTPRTVVVSDRAATFSGLASATTYKVSVVAVTKNGTSDPARILVGTA